MGRHQRHHRGHRGWFFPLIAMAMLFQLLKLAILLIVTVTQWALTFWLLDVLMIAALLIIRWIGGRAFRTLGIRWAELAEYHQLEQQNQQLLDELYERFNRLSVYDEEFDLVAERLVEAQARQPKPPRWAFWIKPR